MLATQQDESTYRVFYRSYLLSAALLLIPPVLLYELGPDLLDGNLDGSELAGLILGIVLPLVGASFKTEFASFSFCRDSNLFSWSWHNFVRRRAGQVPLGRVVKVRREAMPSSVSATPRHIYRLVVILDDDTVIPLTRGYSRVHEKRLSEIVDQIREHLGHFVAIP